MRISFYLLLLLIITSNVHTMEITEQNNWGEQLTEYKQTKSIIIHMKNETNLLQTLSETEKLLASLQPQKTRTRGTFVLFDSEEKNQKEIDAIASRLTPKVLDTFTSERLKQRNTYLQEWTDLQKKDPKEWNNAAKLMLFDLLQNQQQVNISSTAGLEELESKISQPAQNDENRLKIFNILIRKITQDKNEIIETRDKIEQERIKERKKKCYALVGVVTATIGFTASTIALIKEILLCS